MTPHDLITSRAYEHMMESFKEHKHNPSTDQRIALRAIIVCLVKMLTGKAGDHYYLSSLDPGTGKTTAVISFIRTVMDLFNGEPPQGILVCMDRHSEIRRYVKDCKLPEVSYAVLVGKREHELNSLGLGSENVNKAPILFTTKEQVRRKSRGISIDDQSSLYFKGQPRSVKVWDESLSVGKDIVINPYDLGRLHTPLSTVSDELVDSIRALENELIKWDQPLYPMPYLPELPHGFFESFKTRKSNDRDLIELLWRLSGQTVTVRREGKTQLIIDCIQSIPDDFPPCLILDASGRLKGTYKIQRSRLDNLMSLPYGNKSYRNLEVSVWRRAGGRGITSDLKTVTPELVKIIKGRPDEKFMFLLYQDQEDPIKEALKKHLTAIDMQRLEYCTWGAHNATNDFCEIPNVIALSAYQYPDSSYDAITRAAGLMTAEQGVFPTQDEISMVKRGEISSEFLQGVTRSKVRKSEDDTCPPCRLWLIAHPKTGLEKELSTIFPDCRVEEWKTQKFILTKKQQEVFELVSKQVKAGLKVFPAAPIRNQLKMQQTPFKKMLGKGSLKTALDSIKVKTVAQSDGYYFHLVA